MISENPGKIPLYNLEVNDLREPAATDKKKTQSLLGPPIILTRGEPAEIEVKNSTNNPTAIHWHGMELESYYDGVAGWTGSGKQTSPPIRGRNVFCGTHDSAAGGNFYLSHSLAR